MALKLRTIGQKLRPSTAIKVRVPEKKADSFYTSPERRPLMAEIKVKRGDRCEDLDHGPARCRSGIRLFGEHIMTQHYDAAPDQNPRLDLTG